MKQLTAMDKGFLLSESREVPMHVAGVSLYTLPEGADTAEFLRSLDSNLRDATGSCSPWCRACTPPCWTETDRCRKCPWA